MRQSLDLAVRRTWRVRRERDRRRHRGRGRMVSTEGRDRHNESVTAIYFEAGGNVAADGGDIAGGSGGVPAVAGIGVAGGRLSDDPDIDVLSGGESGGDG